MTTWIYPATPLGQGKRRVSAGEGTAVVTIRLADRPPEGAEYETRTGMRPGGASSGGFVDYCGQDIVIGEQIPVTPKSE